MDTSREIALMWLPQNTFDDKTKLAQVKAWCRQATSNYLTYFNPDLCRHIASLIHNELKTYFWIPALNALQPVLSMRFGAVFFSPSIYDKCQRATGIKTEENDPTGLIMGNNHSNWHWGNNTMKQPWRIRANCTTWIGTVDITKQITTNNARIYGKKASIKKCLEPGSLKIIGHVIYMHGIRAWGVKWRREYMECVPERKTDCLQIENRKCHDWFAFLWFGVSEQVGWK